VKSEEKVKCNVRNVNVQLQIGVLAGGSLSASVQSHSRQAQRDGVLHRVGFLHYFIAGYKCFETTRMLKLAADSQSLLPPLAL
jgi:hypothetical protein